jgi:hypothetical protein
MHPRANEDPVAGVEEQGGIVRVDAIEGEAEDARAILRGVGPEDVEARFVGQRLRDAAVEGGVVGSNVVPTYPVEVVDTGAGTQNARVVLKTRLEPMGGRTQAVLGQRRPLDRLPSDDERS